VHDLYSITVGAYTLAAATYLVHHRSAILSPRVTRAQLHAVASIAYFVALVGFILPSLLSVTVLAYVQLPLSLLSQSTTSPDSLPTIYLLHCWATGVVGLSVIYRLARYFTPRTPPMRVDLESALVLFRTGTLLGAGEGARLANWYISPITIQLIVFLTAPVFFAQLYTYFKALVGGEPWPAMLSATSQVITRHFAVTGSILLGMFVKSKGKQMGEKWAQRKLEESFLVEKRLRNYEKPAAADEGDELVRLEEID